MPKTLDGAQQAKLRECFDRGLGVADASFELTLSLSTVSKYYEAFRREKLGNSGPGSRIQRRTTTHDDESSEEEYVGYDRTSAAARAEVAQMVRTLKKLCDERGGSQ